MIPENLQNLLDKTLKVLEDSGVKISEKPKDLWSTWATSETLFRFYWNGISSIDTPLGRIPMTSMSGNGMSFIDAEKSLKEFFGLELVETINGMTGERWFIYRPTKNV